MSAIQSVPSLAALHRQVDELSHTVATLVAHLSAAVASIQSHTGLDCGAAESTWYVRQPKRNDALSWPIFLVLKDAHDRGLAKPTAMGVMEAFGRKCPPEVIEIMPREIKYYSLAGEIKCAGLPEIRSRIYRMTGGKNSAKHTMAAQSLRQFAE